MTGSLRKAKKKTTCRGRLVDGHSIIVPTEHVASTRQVDEHIWTELRNFKKCVLQMYMAQVVGPCLLALASTLLVCFALLACHVVCLLACSVSASFLAGWLAGERACVRACLRVCLRVCLRAACVRSCVHACMCVCMCVCMCMRACLRACSRACLRACLRACISCGLLLLQP